MISVTSIKEIALDYYDRHNWFAFPAHPTEKKPYGGFRWKPYGDILPDRSDLSSWREWDARGVRIAARTGRVSGIFVLDCDSREALEYVRQHGHEPTPMVQSGREGGGQHIYFKHPGFKVKNATNLAGIPGMDIRGEGGIVIVPPSPHASGRKYEWIISPDEATPAPAPQWLLDLLQQEQEYKEPLDVAETLAWVPEGQRDSKLFSLAAKLRNMDIPREVAMAMIEVAANNCDPPFPISEAQKKVEWVWKEYSPGEAYLVMGGQTTNGHHPDSLNTLNALNAFSRGMYINNGSSALPEAPEFPVGALPEAARRLVVDGSLALGCLPELIAIPALAVLSSGIGASRTIRLKRSWEEGATLFMAVVASPGAKKTPAWKLAAKCVFKRQRRLKEEFFTKKEEFDRESREYEVEKKVAAREGVPAPPPPQWPVMQRTVAEDTTVEALVSILQGNPRGLMVYRDELTAWIRSMDQYKGGKGADRQHWLSLWSNSPVVVDRKSKQGEPVILEKPFVSLFGGIQPAMLPALVPAQEDGLLDRFLFSYPKARPFKYSDEDIHPSVEENFHQLYEKLCALEMIEDDFGDEVASIVHLSPEAKMLFRGIVDGLSVEAYDPGFPLRLQGVWSKLEGYVARIALVIALCRCVNTTLEHQENTGVQVGVQAPLETIEKEDMEAAHEIIKYFKAHARRVYAELHAATPLDLLALSLCSLLKEEDNEWSGSATELYQTLKERDADGLPENPDALSKMTKAIDARTDGIEVQHKRKSIDGAVRRVISMRLLEIGVQGVQGVQADEEVDVWEDS